MDRETFEREKRVILYGQSVRFRIVKYAILLPVFGALYLWKGWSVALKALGIAALFAIALHFLYRWKTNAWRSSWGGFKPLDK